MTSREQRYRDFEQKRTQHLADFVWIQLHHLFRKKWVRRPPVYFFLSSESHGSLSKRELDEVLLVRAQQAQGEGITLLRKPQMAFVSDISQVPEEVAHLFALTHGPKKKLGRSLRAHYRWMTDHEAFARMCAILMGRISGHELTARRRKSNLRLGKTPKLIDLWRKAHEEGYRRAEELALDGLRMNRGLKIPASGAE